MRAKYMPGFRDCNCNVLWKRIISLVRSRASRKSALDMSATKKNVRDIRDRTREKNVLP